MVSCALAGTPAGMCKKRGHSNLVGCAVNSLTSGGTNLSTETWVNCNINIAMAGVQSKVLNLFMVDTQIS